MLFTINNPSLTSNSLDSYCALPLRSPIIIVRETVFLLQKKMVPRMLKNNKCGLLKDHRSTRLDADLEARGIKNIVEGNQGHFLTTVLWNWWKRMKLCPGYKIVKRGEKMEKKADVGSGFDRTDVSHADCKSGKKYANMKAGQILEIQADDEGAHADIPAWCEQTEIPGAKKKPKIILNIM